MKAVANSPWLTRSVRSSPSSIDFEVTLRNVARLAVPRLADWCAVYRVEPDGDVTELIAEHTDPSRQELLARLRKEYPPDSENPTAHRKVVVTGQPEHYPEITPELIRMTARDETHAALLGELGLLSLVSVPLVVEERIWGAISIATDESSGRRLGEGDLSLAVEIARRRVALAELLALSPGDVLEMSAPLSASVALVVDGAIFARGELVDVEGSLGVRITSIGSKPSC